MSVGVGGSQKGVLRPPTLARGILSPYKDIDQRNYGWNRKMTNWPDLAPNDLVLYQNDVTRPNRLVLSKVDGGFMIRIDTPLFDTRFAPALTRSDLIDIATKLIRATRTCLE